MAEPDSPPVTKYELTVTIHANSHEEINRELLTLSRGRYLLASGYHERDDFDSTTGTCSLRLKHTNPEQTPEKYTAELEAWWQERKQARKATR